MDNNFEYSKICSKLLSKTFKVGTYMKNCLNKNLKKYKSKKLSNIMIKLLVVLLLSFGVILVPMYNERVETRRLAYQYMEDTARLYIEMLENDISSINTQLVMMLLKEHSEIIQLPNYMVPTETKYYQLFDDVIDKNKNLKMQYKNYTFFEYHHESDLLIKDTGVYFSTSKKDEFSAQLIEHISHTMQLSVHEPLWRYINIDNKNYLCGIFKKNGVAVGGIINIEDFLNNLHISNLEYEGIPFIIDETKSHIIASPNERIDWKTIIKKVNNNASEDSEYTIQAYEVVKIGRIYMLLFPSNNLTKLILSQTQLWMMFMIMGVFIVLSYYYYIKVLRPMKKFVLKMQGLDEDVWLNAHDNNGLLELEMASNQFRALMRRIKTLKIAVYEKELEQKKAELEFVQEQFKPHFLLSCISIIHGMAEQIQAENIVEVSEKLSKYMRYIIGDPMKQHTIQDELVHIQSYVDIQKMRYGEAFVYEVITEEEIEKCMVPSLLLHVFVANAIEHGIVLERQIEITLYITKEVIREEEYLYIILTDTGNGFTPEVLNFIKTRQPIIYDGREHLGIKNSLKRLEILYGKKASIQMFNMNTSCGAVVEIKIPLCENE